MGAHEMKRPTPAASAAAAPAQNRVLDVRERAASGRALLLRARVSPSASGAAVAAAGTDGVAESTASTSPGSSSLSALTKADACWNRSDGSLARARWKVSFRDGCSAGLRLVGRGGSLWITLYRTGVTPSPSKGLRPVNAS